MNSFERSIVWAKVQSTDCWPISRSCAVVGLPLKRTTGLEPATFGLGRRSSVALRLG
jgi:hypothetical protein